MINQLKYLSVIMLTLSMTACYEDTDVTFYEAGEYKGKFDPHSQTKEERSAILAKRFGQVQTDR